MKTVKTKPRQLSLAIASVTAALSAGMPAKAQEEDNPGAVPEFEQPVMEEVQVLGRLQDSATSIIIERIEQAYSAEILSFDQITRVGDSNIASALRRVTGLTLVDGKFIYVRGLGERYSSTTLNGAAVPSPDLTRNVVPLDLFPTSIIDSLKVHKAYSSDMPAAFGGGNIDIRTKSVPDGPVFSISFGTGWNTESSDDGIGPVGGGGGLPAAIDEAINTYRGDIGINSIVRILDTDGGSPSPEQLAQAEAINRQLMLSLNRDIEIRDESLAPDIGGKVSLGNSWDINDEWVFGALANVSFDKDIRNENQIRRGVGDPRDNVSDIRKTVETEDFTGALNLGLTYLDSHSLRTNSYVLQNDEDEARILSGFDANNTVEDGRQKLRYSTRLEERELTVNQVLGEHTFEDGDFGYVWIPQPFTSIDIDWFYSDAKATTDIPNETTIQGTNDIDPNTLEVTGTRLSSTTSMAQFAFLELEDKVESYGMNFTAYFTSGNWDGSISGGWSDIEKSREYYGYTANINAVGVLADALDGTPGQVLTDENLLDPNNSFDVSLGTGFGTESYLAAQLTDTIHGSFDVTWNSTWRFSAGVRWEDFRQAVLPVDLLDFTGASVRRLIEELQDPDQRIAIRDDDIYPAMALTYIRNGFMGAEDFQLRFGYGQTVVRPDLREVAAVQYIDPELEVRVEGNASLEFSEIDHFDLRAEWFYDNRDSFTASLFYKDITAPIEQVRFAGTDDDVTLGFVNAESGEVYGIEFEALKDLASVYDPLEGFFFSGNLTLSDSEIEIGGTDIGLTNNKRRLTGHSEYVVNAQLGYDSADNYHSLSVVYNVFGERIFYGGRDGNDDAFEQPFHSLDVVYSFYPTDNATLKLRVQNLLDESREFEQKNPNGENATIIEQDVGTSVSVDFSWKF